MDKFGRLPSLGTERWDAPRAGKSTDNMALPVSGDDTSTRVSKTQLDLQNENEADTLSIAKDRGQVTMTSAMSMTNVALLKAVLDRGPEKHRFYAAVLTLTCLALGLQILAGVLSMCVSQLRNYYQKFHDNLGSTVQCCPVAVIWRTPTIEEEEAPGKCCPCDLDVVSHFYSDYELGIIDDWKDWVEEDTEHDMNTVEANLMLLYLDSIISTAREKLDDLDDQRKSMSEDVYLSKSKELRDEIDAAYNRKPLYERSRCDADKSNAKGAVLSTALHDIVRNHTLKRAQTWQYVINVLLYAAFIVSAFLTGLGLAS